MTETPVTDWRTLRCGDRVRVIDPEDDSGTTGRVDRVEPCPEPESAWVYVRFRRQTLTGPLEWERGFLLVDGDPPRLAVLA